MKLLFDVSSEPSQALILFLIAIHLGCHGLLRKIGSTKNRLLLWVFILQLIFGFAFVRGSFHFQRGRMPVDSFKTMLIHVMTVSVSFGCLKKMSIPNGNVLGTGDPPQVQQICQVRSWLGGLQDSLPRPRSTLGAVLPAPPYHESESPRIVT